MRRLLQNQGSRVLPVAVFLGLAGLVMGAAALLRTHERAWTGAALSVAADQTARYLTDYVDTRQTLAAEVAAVANLDRARPGPGFAAAAAQIQTSFPGIQAITHVSADGIIDAIAPAQGNAAALGLDLARHPVVAPLLAKARASGRWVASPLFTLAQAGTGFVCLMPLKQGRGRNGYVEVVFRIEALAGRVWRMSESSGIALLLRDGGQTILRIGRLDPTGLRETRAIAVADRQWTLIMGPESAPVWRMAAGLLQLIGIAIAALVAFLLHHALLRRAALHASEERYRSLVEGSIQGMIVYRDGKVLFANRAAGEMLGFAERNATAMPTEVADLLPRPGGAEAPRLPEAERLEPGKVHDFEIETRRCDGEPIWLRLRASRVEWETIPVVQLTLSDVTNYKRAEAALMAAKEEAEHASRAKSTFLAHMSHELRTPLNAVIGFSEILHSELMGPLGNARYREYAGDITEAGRHLLAVINDILDVAKFEAGRLILDEKAVSLPDVTAACLRMLHERADAAHVRMEAHMPAGLPQVWADESKMKQILLNLLSNALKFTPTGGHVAVTAHTEGDGGVTVTVQDTGIGMEPEDIPRALEPFTQIGRTPTSQQQGTGLGLPLAKALAVLHGGSLEVESAPGQGTSVSLHLPADRVEHRHAA